MRIRTRRLALPSVALAALLGAAACAGTRAYATRSVPPDPDHQVAIDGNSEDWVGRLSFLKTRGVAVGFMNDARYLYACLLIEGVEGQDPLRLQGLTVWFDPAGGKDKVVGIQYPLGMANRRGKPGAPAEEPQEPPVQGEDQEGAPGAPPARRDGELRFLRKGVPPETMSLERAANEGVLVATRAAEGSSVYELRIPLALSRPGIAIGSTPEGTVGVTFETGPLPMGSLRGVGAGAVAAGRGNPGGYSGNYRGRRGMNLELPPEVKFHVEVRLSPEGGAAPISSAVNE